MMFITTIILVLEIKLRALSQLIIIISISSSSTKLVVTVFCNGRFICMHVVAITRVVPVCIFIFIV